MKKTISLDNTQAATLKRIIVRDKYPKMEQLAQLVIIEFVETHFGKLMSNQKVKLKLSKSECYALCEFLTGFITNSNDYEEIAILNDIISVLLPKIPSSIFNKH